MPALVPTSVLEARGAFAKHPERRNKLEPVAGEIGPPPDDLEPDEKACWDEVVSMCAPGVFQSSDRVVLEQFAVLLAESRQGRKREKERLEKGPQDANKGDGYYVGFSNRSRDALLQLCIQFGMTPVARRKLEVAPDNDHAKKKTGLAAYR